MRHALGAESAKAYRLHPCEKALAWIAAIILIFQPWALGGMRFWSQWTVGALAVLAMALALLPRNYTDEHHAGDSFRMRTWPKLLRFPIFWIGLIYFVIILIQIANPAWRYTTSAEGWWLTAIEHITWLPHGVADTPADKMNGWRTLLIQGSAWLLVCALWIGITRRKSARILINTIALNGVVIALVLLAQRLIGAKKLLWLFKAPAAYFAGPFIYKNHAGAFLILILALCLGLAWWHKSHAERRLQKSHPGALFVIFAILVAVALMFTYARATTALGGSLILFVALGFAIHSLFKRHHGPPRIVTVITTLIGIAFISLCVSFFNTDAVWKKFDRLFGADKFASVTSREIATQATVEMAQTSLISGHGAGSFRFLFPLYQQHHPEIWKQGRRHLYWEHAHNDYAEFLSEMGLLGVSLAILALIVVVVALRKNLVFSQPPLLIFIAGPALVGISGYVDFPMHNPAVLVTGLAVITLTLRWAQLSRR